MKSRDISRSRAHFAELVTKMIDESVGKFHRWPHDEDATGGVSAQCGADSKPFIADPDQILEMRSSAWSKI